MDSDDILPSEPHAAHGFAHQAIRGPAWLALAGIGFIYGSVVAFGVVCFMLFNGSGKAVAVNYKPSLIDYAPELIIASIGVFGSVLGVSLLRSVGLATAQPNRVINENEWEALSEQVKSGQEEPITQYIRLTSLSGFTGTFTKLGLTALPLATIGLTLFFSIMAISYPAFMELTKLTLGAFIGSFVQKQVSSQGSVKLPTGETVPVKSSLEP